jgi:hypothetical protein
MKGMLSKVVLTQTDDPKKEGYLNLWEIQKKDAPNLSINRVREILRVGVKQGVLETKKFKVVWNGKPRPIWHWREKK